MQNPINHNALSRLAESGAIRSANLIGEGNGWSLSIKYGLHECLLQAERSKRIRKFKKLETAMKYLKRIGIAKFSVDASGFEHE